MNLDEDQHNFLGSDARVQEIYLNKVHRFIAQLMDFDQLWKLIQDRTNLTDS